MMDVDGTDAYLYRANITTPFPIASVVATKTFIGPHVQEVRQTMKSWATQSIRLYTGDNKVEIQSTVGPVDVSDGIGKEIITR